MIDKERDVEQELVVIDEDTMTLVNSDTGEIIGYAETPEDDVDTVKLAEWVGERLAYHRGRIEGLQAERQVWLDTIEARYGAQLRRHEGASAWLKAAYSDRLMELAQRIIGDGKKRSTAFGLLLLKLRKTSAKTEVVNPEKAIAWLKAEGYSFAVKVTESVLTSQIPDDAKAALTEDATGMTYYPGGEDKLVIE